MLSQKLETAFKYFNLSYRENNTSIIMKHCHLCDNDNYKVYFFIPKKTEQDPNAVKAWGKCFRCDEKTSIFQYLKNFGTHEEIKNILGYKDEPKTTIDSSIAEFLDSIIDKEEESQAPLFEIELEKPRYLAPTHYKTMDNLPNSAAAKYAASRGVVGELKKDVLINPYENSVCFPIRDIHDRLVGFQERYVTPKVFTNNGKQFSLKCKTEGGVSKSSSVILVGDETKPVCVVEGPFDAVAAAWFGYFGVCTLGCSCSKEQIEIIRKYSRGNTIYIGYDPDQAGEKGSVKLAKTLDGLGLSYKKLRPLLKSEDLSSMLTKYAGFQLSLQEEPITLEGLIVEDRSFSWIDLDFLSI